MLRADGRSKSFGGVVATNGFSFELIDGGSGEASARLRGAGGEAPGAVIGAFGEKDPAVVPSQRNHRSRHQHRLVPDRLSQSP